MYYKSTGQVAEATKFFEGYSTPNKEDLALREIVLARKRPLPIFVQPVVTESSDGEIVLKTYPTNYFGVISSFADRFSSGPILGQSAEEALEAVWRRDLPFFEDIPL
ncbi:unnamed protein product [Protopolystoma xenopodis]|uniref:Uncharacterized protein n=1 Tax=Protopolystoma xenopodis TaxID=117903 RepID=A0A448X6I3_9PLAT|nr:unnamed protein product [Protopolystoma xenopodis]